jgi:hypothetical protein
LVAEVAEVAVACCMAAGMTAAEASAAAGMTVAEASAAPSPGS